MKYPTPGINSASTQPLYTVQDAAEQVGITRTTLTTWIESGLVTPQYAAGQNSQLKLFTADGIKRIEQVHQERAQMRGQMRLPAPKKSK